MSQRSQRDCHIILPGGRAAETPGLELTREVQTNMVYAAIPPEAVKRIRERYLFFVFDEKRWEVWLVTNYDTTQEDVRSFAEAARQAVADL